MKVKFEGVCPHCQKRIELVRELSQDIINQIRDALQSKSRGMEIKTRGKHQGGDS